MTGRRGHSVRAGRVVQGREWGRLSKMERRREEWWACVGAFFKFYVTLFFCLVCRPLRSPTEAFVCAPSSPGAPGMQPTRAAIGPTISYLSQLGSDSSSQAVDGDTGPGSRGGRGARARGWGAAAARLLETGTDRRAASPAPQKEAAPWMWTPL